MIESRQPLFSILRLSEYDLPIVNFHNFLVLLFTLVERLPTQLRLDYDEPENL